MKRTLFTTTLIVFAIAFMLQTSSDCEAQPQKETAAQTKDGHGFHVLKGRWLRPDGGYIIQIRSVDGSGKMDAGYFNPGPSMFLKRKQREKAER